MPLENSSLPFSDTLPAKKQTRRVPKNTRVPKAFDSWRAEQAAFVGEIYDLELVDETFHAEAAFVSIPKVIVSQCDFCAMTYRRTPDLIRSAPFDHIMLQATEVGGLDFENAGRMVAARAGTTVFGDLGRPSVNQSLSTRGRVMIMDRSLFPSSSIDSLAGQMIDGARHNLLNDFMGWLLGSLPRARLNAMARTEAAISAVVLACMDPASIVEAPAREILGGLALARAQAYIDRHAAEPMSMDTIAAAAFVSRATLFRLFKPLGGVMAYVWRARLDLARRRLSDPAFRGSISVIAADAGFATDAHFSRRFTEAYGFSPRNLRPF